MRNAHKGVLLLFYIILSSAVPETHLRHVRPLGDFITIQTQPVVELCPEITTTFTRIPIKTLSEFLTALGHRESGNRYDIVNSYGYLGKYQFHINTLRHLGYDVTKKEFLDSPELQEEAMLALMDNNRRVLRRYIQLYHGKVINGVQITESGILAAAHLAGPGNVKRFFNKGYEFRDGYGTKLTTYIRMFNSYHIGGLKVG
jgi:hypothetical protein